MDWEGDGECNFVHPNLTFLFSFFFTLSILLEGLEMLILATKHRTGSGEVLKKVGFVFFLSG